LKNNIKKISIIIPAYNEEKIINSTIIDIKKKIKNNGLDYEIIVVDDGSSDNTSEIVNNMKEEGVMLIKLKTNQGKGGAVKAGIYKSSGDFLLYTDADNSTSIDHLFDFLPYIKEYDIIIGSRSLPKSKIIIKQPLYKIVIGKIGAILIKKILDLDYHDTQCGFKLFNSKIAKEIFKEVDCSRWAFDFELLKIAKIKKIKVKEMPVTWINNFDTKVKMIDYIETLKSLFIIWKKYR
jgi:dolichyl-phosphate beta-glucosyltransferase